MLLLDTGFLIELEDELVNRKSGPARAVLTAHRRQAAAISIITLGEFAEGFYGSQGVGGISGAVPRRPTLASHCMAHGRAPRLAHASTGRKRRLDRRNRTIL